VVDDDSFVVVDLLGMELDMLVVVLDKLVVVVDKLVLDILDNFDLEVDMHLDYKVVDFGNCLEVVQKELNTFLYLSSVFSNFL